MADGPTTKGTIAAYGLVAVGAAAGAGVDAASGVEIEVDEDFAVFAIFYIVAQAVERLVEPLARPIKQTETKEAKQKVKGAAAAVEAARAQPGQPGLTAAAEAESAAQEELADVLTVRGLWAWAIASTAALVACGLLGLGLIEAVADVQDEKWWFQTVDLIVTGLAIGAGTKPLHDLISRLEKSKQNADPATQPTGG